MTYSIEPWEKGIYIAMLVENILALISNLVLAILIYKLRQEHHKLSFKLILIMTICDLLNSLSRMPTNLNDMGNAENLFLDIPFFCYLTIFLPLLTSLLSLCSAALLALERYFSICLSYRLNNFKGLLVLLIIFILFLVPSIGSLVELNSLGGVNQMCAPPLGLFRIIRNHMYYILLFFTLILLIYCYVQLFLFTNKYYTQHPNHLMKKLRNNVTIRAFLFISLYTITVLPTILSFSIQMNAPGLNHVSLDIITLLMVNLLTFLNPLLVLVLHKKYFKVFNQLIGRNAKNDFFGGHGLSSIEDN